MRGKRGWIRILEATIAVLIVSATMLAVYSQQTIERDSVKDYAYTVQKEALADISSNENFRLLALGVQDDSPGDSAYDTLNAFVASNIPPSFGFYLRVCELGDADNHCKMDSEMFKATMDYDIFVEEVVISAEIGDGTNEVYSPKKVRLFFWEGGFPEDYCISECALMEDNEVCSGDKLGIVSVPCADYGNECYKWNKSAEMRVDCGASEVCNSSVEWEDNSDYELVCGLKANESIVRCGDGMKAFCLENGFDGYNYMGDSDHVYYDVGGSCDSLYFNCWLWADKDVTSCGQNPGCVAEVGAGDEMIEKRACFGAGVVGASVSLGFSGISTYNTGGVYHYDHTRTFTESNGVGITFDWGQLCTTASGCNSAVVSYTVNANSQLVLNNHNFHTALLSETFILRYNGTDDNNNDVSIQETVIVSGTTWVSP